MSTTAGLGSGDYVAVNGAAVFALLLGLASALSLMTELLLIVPLACVVTSIIAFRQISQSNGTQTGKGLIVLGLLFALGFGGFVFARTATEGIRTREDRQAIGQVIKTLDEKMKAGDAPAVHALFTDRFTSRWPIEQFAARMKLMEYYGKLTGITWNELAEFNTDETTGNRYAVVQVTVKYTKPGQEPTPIDEILSLRSVEGKWQIDDSKQLWPAPQPPKQ